MKQAKINIAFPVRLDTDGNGFSYVDDNRLHVSCYGTNGIATKQLRDGLQKHVDIALENNSRSSKQLIVCADGHVIMCEYNGGFVYHIASSGRGYASSCLQQWNNFDELCKSARDHAESAYGGIAWESSV